MLDGGWPGDDGERIVGRDCRGDGVASDGRQIGQQRLETVDLGIPSGVHPVVGFRTAAGERCACATTLARNASAASLSVSSNSIGARR